MRERDWEAWGEQLERERSPLEVVTMAIAIEVVLMGIAWLAWQWLFR